MDKKQIKEKIIEMEEYDWTAGYSLCGRYVYVRNLKVRKDKAVADVILTEPESGTTKRYNECEYPMRLFN